MHWKWIKTNGLLRLVPDLTCGRIGTGQVIFAQTSNEQVSNIHKKRYSFFLVEKMITTPICWFGYICLMRYLILTCLAFISVCCKAQEELRVVLIRHAEKPLTGDNLSCAGFERAIKLPGVIKNKYGIPSEIFTPAPTTGKSTKNVRMLQTAWPLAVKYNLPVNTHYTVEESDKLARVLQKRSGTVLVVWEHKEIVAIAQALGVEGALNWPANDYDTIWLITFKSRKPVLSIDHENIRPAPGCPF